LDGATILSVLGGFLAIFWSFYRYGIVPQFDAIKEKVKENAEELGKHSEVLNEHSDRLSRVEEGVEWLRDNSDSNQ